LVELTWTQEISEPGTYWYVDIDYTTPVQVEIDDRNVVHLDGDVYTTDELIQEAGHFYGPINIEIPKISESVIECLDTRREEIMAIAEG